MELQTLIMQYIDRIPDQREKAAVNSLLLNLLPVHTGDKLTNIPVKTLQMRKDLRKELADALCDLYSSVTTSKEEAKRRIVEFAQYLKDSFSIELSMEDMLASVSMNAYERLVDLLKTLQEGMTKQELLEHYVVSRKVLEKDLDKLIKGTKILGQRVRIRNLQSESRGLTYQSTIHPIFLPLNMTEVYYLFSGLKLLARKHTVSAEMYNSLANRIYVQLSDYARRKIKTVAKEYGFILPPDDEFQFFMSSVDEEKMARDNIKNTLLYLFKSQTKCTICLKNESKEIIRDCYISLAGHNSNIVEIFKKPGEQPFREVTIDEIEMVIDFKYI